MSHSVCVLFSDFSRGQLWYKQIGFKVVGLNKSLHDILMIRVFGDCKTRLKISEGIYFCFLGQADIREIDLVQFFWLKFCLFFSILLLWDAFALLIMENNLLLKLKLLPNVFLIFDNFFKIWNSSVFQGLEPFSIIFSLCHSMERTCISLMVFILDRFLLLSFLTSFYWFWK